MSCKIPIYFFATFGLLAAYSDIPVKAVFASNDQVVNRIAEQGEMLSNNIDDRLAGLDSGETPKNTAERIYMLSLENFIQIAKDDLRIPKMILWRGNYYFDRAVYEKAIQNYKRIILKYPETPFYIESMKQIAKAYARNGEFDKAETWYRRLRTSGLDHQKKETRDDLAGIMYRNARQYERKGAFNKAGATYFRIAKKFPDVDIAPRALIDAGRMKENLGNWKGAIKLYRVFLKRYYESPHVPRVLFREAICWERSRAYKISAKKHLNVVRLFPASQEASQSLLSAGRNFEQSKEFAIAARIYERYAELYPKNGDICSILPKARDLFLKSELHKNAETINTQYKAACGTF